MNKGDFISVHRSVTIHFTTFTLLQTVCSYSSARYMNNFEIMHYPKFVIVSVFKCYLLVWEIIYYLEKCC